MAVVVQKKSATGKRKSAMAEVKFSRKRLQHYYYMMQYHYSTADLILHERLARLIRLRTRSLCQNVSIMLRTEVLLMVAHQHGIEDVAA